MKKKTKIKKAGIALFAILLAFPLTSEALCLKDCVSTSSSPQFNNSTLSYQPTEQRQESHNFGNNSTSVLGDVRIQVGHERVEISGPQSGSNNNFVDASVQSTIILGDLQQ